MAKNNTIKARIIPRHGTAESWRTSNPVLLNGELGVETDTGKIKFGDGVVAWNSLPYMDNEIDHHVEVRYYYDPDGSDSVLSVYVHNSFFPYMFINPLKDHMITHGSINFIDCRGSNDISSNLFLCGFKRYDRVIVRNLIGNNSMLFVNFNTRETTIDSGYSAEFLVLGDAFTESDGGITYSVNMITRIGLHRNY